MNLKISPDLALPLDAAMTAQAILAIRGAGKSYTSRKFIEQLAKASVQTIVIDPTGVHYGVRSSADGKSAGLSFIIMGGNHADVPLEETAGEVVAEFIVESSRSVVLDLSILRKTAQKRFMTDFAEHLYHLKGKAGRQSPLHIVMDEADRFAPQKPQPEFLRLLGAIEDWVRLGRSRGFGLTMISQRAALLNKDVLTQVETLIVLRTTSPQDRKAIQAWVEENASKEEFAQIAQSLASLPNGAAWIWSPLLMILKQVQISRIETFDSMATPKIGQVKAEPKKMAPVDLDALKGRIAETIERAKANDPGLLKRRIAELEKQLAKPTISVISPKSSEPKRIEIPVLKDGQVKRLEALVPGFGKKADAIINGLTELVSALGAFQSRQNRPTSSVPAAVPTLQPRSAPAKPILTGNPGQNGIGKGERAILKAVAQYPDGATTEQITVLTTYKRSSRNTYVQKLKQAGYVQETLSGLIATQEGIAALGSDYEPLPTGEALRMHWLGILGGGEREILRILIQAYPKSVEKEDLETLTHYKRSSRNTYLQKLLARQIITAEGRSGVKASAVLF